MLKLKVDRFNCINSGHLITTVAEHKSSNFMFTFVLKYVSCMSCNSLPVTFDDSKATNPLSNTLVLFNST